MVRILSRSFPRADREAVQLREAAVCVLRDLRCTACAAEVRLHFFPFFADVFQFAEGSFSNVTAKLFL